MVAWGSLVWRPTDRGVTLQLRRPGQWEPDGPWLPVEFARISSGGALTLVVVPSYAARVRTLWSRSVHHQLEDAIRNLADREGITQKLESIHGVSKEGSRIGSVDDDIASAVRAWLLEQPTLDIAIWAGLSTSPTSWRELGYAEGFTLDNALAYLRTLNRQQDHPAFEYMTRAPEQIATPVRERAKDEGII